jgi:PAS domain S-box-containing protein
MSLSVQNELRGLVRAGQICAATTLVLGVAGLAGWIFDEPILLTLWKGGSAMKFNTAVALTLTGSGLLLAAMRGVWWRRLACVPAALLILISGATLLQYVFSANFGIDELIFRDRNFVATTHAGRMAWYTASSMLLLGTGTLLLSRKTSHAFPLTQWLALAAGFFPIQALIGYFYATMAVLGMTMESGYMSVPTAMALLCGAAALLLHAPGRGMMAILTSPSPGSVASRGLLIFLIIVPLVMGWVVLHLVRRGEHTIEYGVATVALITVVLLVTLTWLNAYRLNRAEQALREREEQLRFVTDHVPVFIVQCDHETRYKFVNAAYAGRFPARPEDIVGKKIREVVGTKAYDSFRHHVEKALAGTRVEFETKIPYEQFGERWMHCIYVPEKAPDGEVVGFVAVIHDVTTRRAAEEALRESEEHFRSLAEGMPHMVWECDRFGAWHYRNAAWTSIAGRQWNPSLRPRG